MKIYGVDGKHVEIYLAYHNHDEQVDILQEECAELVQALSKLKRRKPGCMYSVKEEMAHVLISVASVAKILDISEEDIDWHVQNKNPKD